MRKVFIFLVLLGLALPVFSEYVAQDPTRYIPSARVLGLGKAYVALSDDTGAMYVNPAGMAPLIGWQLASMSGKFLDEYNYLSFSGLYASDYGTIGIGFAGTSITGAFATTIESGSDPDDPIYTIDPSQPQMGNYNNALVVSYANILNEMGVLQNIPNAENLSVGASLKLYQVALYGDHISGGDAAGMDMDVGIKYFAPQKWATFGLAVQNLLPMGMGGKLRYAVGHEESYPAVIELGTALQLLGKENAMSKLGANDLKLMLDMDYHPTLRNYPVIMHLGVEWKPVSFLAIRGGVDQDASGDGRGGMNAVSDLTYGVGLYAGGFRFDYAYHSFAGAPGMDNNFFSFNYAVEPPVIKKVKEPMEIKLPADQLVTFEGSVEVSGKIMENRTRKLVINGVQVKFNLAGEFTTAVNLKVGKNAVLIELLDEKGIKIADKKIRILRLEEFPDVAQTYWAARPISLLAMSDVITGYPDGSFRPEGNINRAEMCTLLVKTLAKAAESREAISRKKMFKDIKKDNWAGNYIAMAVSKNIVKGYPDKTFRPKANITRAEGVSMAAHFAGITEEAYTFEFPDVTPDHWVSGALAGAYRAGLLEYLRGKEFNPNQKLTRAETVELLQRTNIVKDLLKRDLLDWDSY